MSKWESDKKWSDKYLVNIKRILGEHLISEPPIAEDIERNTDLMVLNLSAVRVGCRVRRADKDYHLKYGDEFTIRTSRPSGAKTELAKIIEGFGDFFFYGFGHEDGSLLPWYLCDMNVFRVWYNRQLYNGVHPGIHKNNRDNSSSFLAFKISELPKEFVIASNAPPWKQ